MDKEFIFNIFPRCNSDIITEIGFRVHEYTGTDEDKINFLLSRVEYDVKEMALIKIPPDFKIELPSGQIINGITNERYHNLLHNGTAGILYESIFQAFNAPTTPLYVSTMIVDGKIEITRQMQLEPIAKTKFTEMVTEKLPNHYLKEFMTQDGFDIVALINSDFMVSIRLLFQNQKYVSCIKLLMSAIDTFAFLEFGDVEGNFKKWLNQYCALSSIGLTDVELWEYRNSIIHMTNSYSRKVINNKVQQLSFYVSKNDIDYLTANGQSKYFNLPTLIDIIGNGLGKWFESYNEDRSKFPIFCDRYDMIISDSRYGSIEYS